MLTSLFFYYFPGGVEADSLVAVGDTKFSGPNTGGEAEDADDGNAEVEGPSVAEQEEEGTAVDGGERDALVEEIKAQLEQQEQEQIYEAPFELEIARMSAEAMGYLEILQDEMCPICMAGILIYDVDLDSRQEKRVRETLKALMTTRRSGWTMYQSIRERLVCVLSCARATSEILPIDEWSLYPIFSSLQT